MTQESHTLSKSTVTLDQTKNVTVVMVIFSVEPSRQQELLDNIMNYGGSLVKHQPGFISSTLHKSTNGQRIVNYTQWKTRQDYETAKSSLGSKTPEIFTVFPPDVHIYEIVEQTISES
ncbi:MAG: antibiotic biosynthesis monooxygenase family protein [Nostocales cyanobacterium 94392]|nr:antibiotic biosynthesis monooxygenase family protein [Nostocales cyanobacterium 94392]